MPGEGTPVTTWIPSRKWAVLVLTGLGTIATMYIADMVWDQTEWGALIALLVTAGTTYLIPNAAS